MNRNPSSRGVVRADRKTTTAPDGFDIRGLTGSIEAGYRRSCAKRGIECGFNGRKYRYQAKEGGK